MSGGSVCSSSWAFGTVSAVPLAEAEGRLTAAGGLAGDGTVLGPWQADSSVSTNGRRGLEDRKKLVFTLTKVAPALRA